AAPAATRPRVCPSASLRRFPMRARRRERGRSLEPRSPVLLGWCVQNWLPKRIETSEWYFPVRPVIGGVAENVQQLLARFLVELGVGRNLLQHNDKAGLRTRLVDRVGHAVVQRVEVLAEMRRQHELLRDQVEYLLLALRSRQVGVQKMLSQSARGILQFLDPECPDRLHD